VKKDLWQDRISEYLDGELTPAEVQRFEEHLAECSECQSTLAELTAVIAAAGQLTLPKPPASLWEGIARRLSVQGLPSVAPREPVVRATEAPVVALPRHRALSLRFAIAAGLLLAALSGGSGWWLRGNQTQPDLAEADTRGDAVPIQVRTDGLPPEIAAALADYAESVAQLELALEQVADRLDPVSYESIQGNLYTLDRAILEARSALSADPQSEYLNAHLANSMLRKVRLLQQATRLASNRI
jgi:hypothetical protein